MVKFQLTRQRILSDAEIIHYFDGRRCIWSRHNQIYVDSVSHQYELEIPATWVDAACGFHRLGRRALRLDKCNVLPADDGLETLVIIRKGCVYHYDSTTTTLRPTLQLRNCRNVLHQSIARYGQELFFGEYGANPHRRSVPVYKSDNGGRSWEVAYEFGAGTIKHTHGCYLDPYDDKIWILTGDFEGECHMVKASRNFRQVETLGDGSQMWRACNLFFEPDHIYWLMDSQLETSFVMRLERGSTEPERLRALPGPAWYIKRLDDGPVLGGTACEIGDGVHDNFAHLYASTDLEQWHEVQRFEHDRLPKRFFKFGVLGFAEGPQSSDRFAMFGEALRGFDGKAGIFSLVPQQMHSHEMLSDEHQGIWAHVIAVFDSAPVDSDCLAVELERVEDKKPSFLRAPLSLLCALLLSPSPDCEDRAMLWHNALLRFTEFQQYRLDARFADVHGSDSEFAAILLGSCLLSAFLFYEDGRYLNAALKVCDTRTFRRVRHRSYCNSTNEQQLVVAATEMTLGIEFALHCCRSSMMEVS